LNGWSQGVLPRPRSAAGAVGGAVLSVYACSPPPVVDCAESAVGLEEVELAR